MTMHIYKMADEKWHRSHNTSAILTQCSQPLTTRKDTMRVGMMSDKALPEPPKSVLCKECFPWRFAKG